MFFYVPEVKEEILQDIEISLINIKSCIGFVAFLEVNDKTNYELEQCSNEYLRLRKLKGDLENSIIQKEDFEIEENDYFLIRRWRYFVLETYKKHFFHRGEFNFYHG